MIIGDRVISPSSSPFIIAEMGAAHKGKLAIALRIIEEARDAGADAIKFQAFTPDSMTLPVLRGEFFIADGPWRGKHLYDLYTAAQTPREWFPQLFEFSRSLGLIPFASVFSPEDCDFVMQFDPALMKIASFELVDLPLIEHVAKQGKPLLLSLGMSTEEEMWQAFDTAIEHLPPGQVKWMRCVSSYPTPIEDSPLAQVRSQDGVSDHSIGIEVAVAATALGATMIEKHLTLSRNDSGLDDGFASEPHEFEDMVKAVRGVHAALQRGDERDRPDEHHRILRRSLFVIKDVKAGEAFSSENVRSIRPGHGLPPSEIDSVLKGVASTDIAAGTPLKWEYIV